MNTKQKNGRKATGKVATGAAKRSPAAKRTDAKRTAKPGASRKPKSAHKAATAYAPTGDEIAAAVDEAAEIAKAAYGADQALAAMFAGASVEESEEPSQPGVFVMATAPDYSHAAMFATALAAEIVADGHALMEAVEYGELEAPGGKGYKVTWYVENHRRA